MILELLNLAYKSFFAPYCHFEYFNRDHFLIENSANFLKIMFFVDLIQWGYQYFDFISFHPHFQFAYLTIMTYYFKLNYYNFMIFP